MRHRLRFRNTTKFALITFFSNFYLYSHVGTLYAQARGLSLLQANSIWSIIVASIFLAEIPTGVLADRISRKWSVVIALLLQTLGEVWYLFARSYTMFVLIAVLAGIGYAFSSGADEALIYDSLPEPDREGSMKRAMGLVGGAYQLAFCFAPLAGGLVVNRLAINNYLRAIFLTACSVAVAFLISLTLEEPREQRLCHDADSLTILREGIGQLRSSKRLLWITAVGVLTSSFSSSLTSLYQPYFVQAQVLPVWLALALSLGALCAFFCQKGSYRLEDALGKRWGLFTAMILPGILYLGLAAASTPVAVIPLFVFTYAILDIKNPLLSAYRNAEIKGESRATVLSMINMMSGLYVAAMNLVIGKIADISLAWAFVTIGALVIFFTLALRADKLAT